MKSCVFKLTEEDVDESIVTPQALAEYLWGTQDFGKFRSALQDIVDSKIVSTGKNSS